MKELEELTKEDLIKLLDEQSSKHMMERATLKELTTTHILKEDTLFITSGGFIIGRPYVDEKPVVSGYIIISDVIIMDSLYPPIRKSAFHKASFQLAIDQIIAFTTIDRESFLQQLESQ
ncbi:MAG: hypothetical protein ACLSV2_08690 [Clostridium sp.]